MRTPVFWYSGHRSLSSTVLTPLGWLYGMGSRFRTLVTTPKKSPEPVICIGNLVAGGAGKTPVALALAGLLEREQKSIGFLTRGYGGNLPGPVFVKPDDHSCVDVGDEALLLADMHPTIVARDRCAGAEEFSKTSIDAIIMDDGFQNPSLHKDLSLIVIDHNQGIGNGRIIPAGPLRGFLQDQVSRAHGFVIIGGELVDKNLNQLLQNSGKPIFTAQLEPADTAPEIAGKKVIAYTGIGMPDKFFATLEKAGAEIVERIRFPDHHPFTPSDAQWLLGLQGDNPGCLLLTTAKDHVRLKNTEGACGQLYQTSMAYGVELKFNPEKALMQFILKAL